MFSMSTSTSSMFIVSEPHTPLNGRCFADGCDSPSAVQRAQIRPSDFPLALLHVHFICEISNLDPSTAIADDNAEDDTVAADAAECTFDDDETPCGGATNGKVRGTSILLFGLEADCVWLAAGGGEPSNDAARRRLLRGVDGEEADACRDKH